MPFRSKKPATFTDSRRHERETAAAIGGRTTTASGSGSDKGDAKSSKLVVECKSTSWQSFAVSIKLMDQITSVAAETGRTGVLHLRFLDDRGRPAREFIVVEAHHLQDLAQ